MKLRKLLRSLKILAIIEFIFTVTVLLLIANWTFKLATDKPPKQKEPSTVQTVQSTFDTTYYTREELLAETNKHRSVPLKSDPVLDNTAQVKCGDMVERDDFSHGDLESYWVMAGRRPSGLAENLARTNESVKKVVDDWVASPTHYANLVDVSWGSVGFGICTFRSETLIVQHFSD